MAGAVVVAPVGDVEHASAPCLMSQLQRAAADGDQPVICCDLTHTDFLDSSASAHWSRPMTLPRSANGSPGSSAGTPACAARLSRPSENELLTCLPTLAAVRAALDRQLTSCIAAGVGSTGM